MSAFQVSSKHLAAILGSARAYRSQYEHIAFGREEAELLAAENARSVNYRYRTTDAPVEVSMREIDQYHMHPLSPVALLKAINCLDYQSCETDDWATTPARKLLNRIEAIAVRALPGYEAAPWGID